MSRKIQILPEPISQMIAAGEVVERPASVVKELVENAIDAEASEIHVELKAGGLQLIRVVDNGEGMAREDVALALRRFATSKIQKVEDLYSIQTLGFRGEALPSIASVSQMTVKTRMQHSISGTQVVCEGGEIKSISEIGCPEGTEVEVKQLFYNLPVRRKFLRSIRTELRYALQHFLRVSLSHHSITFKFIHDGRMLQELLKTDSPLVRIEAVLGRESADHLQPIAFEDSEVRISGFTSFPSLTKGNADGISIYINRRYVRDRIIYKAILDAYRHINPADKFPIVILFIYLPPSSVDVNVHPAKSEVKFKEPERIYHTVSAAIRRVLEERPRPAETISSDRREEAFLKEEFQSSLPFRNSSKPPYAPMGEDGIGFPRVGEGEGPLWEAQKRFPLRIVGQIRGTYILCEEEGRLIFIDQHAAHEKILFEKFKREYENRSLVSEKLLVPILMELSVEESLILESAGEAFQAIGFEIEPVGESLYAIGSIPSFIGQNNVKDVVKEILEELSLLKRGGEGSGALQSLLVSLACHSAVRANSLLRREEMEELVGNLYPFHCATTCPHGRPIFFLFSIDELGRQFRRNPSGL
ncbi:MAG: DNA mismatch repair endonuclease MutL [Thermodesulfobacteriota bacterium]|nr:DNA mismatch repair endonuclease MutL [Thermodesulfobacteriota bacterium]